MAVSLEIGVNELGVAQVKLERLARRAADAHPLMDAIGAAMESSTMQRFEDERAPDGQRWKPSLRALQSGGVTLTDTGRLKGSMTHRATRDTAEVGTNVIYAGVHQGGATIRGKSGGRLKFAIPGLGFRSPLEVVIPARPFLGIDQDDRDTIEELVDGYLMGPLQ